MRLALGAIHEVTDEKLKFAKQLGVEDIIVHTPELRGEGYWEFLDLLHLRMRVESASSTRTWAEPRMWSAKKNVMRSSLYSKGFS